MRRHPDCEEECQVAAARGAHKACYGVCAEQDSLDSRPFSAEQQAIIDAHEAADNGEGPQA